MGNIPMRSEIYELLYCFRSEVNNGLCEGQGVELSSKVQEEPLILRIVVSISTVFCTSVYIKKSNAYIIID